MIFRDPTTNQLIHLCNTKHTSDERAIAKGNSLFRVPPKFNLNVFKKIISKLNIMNHIDEYIVAVLEYNDKERIHFLIKVENSQIHDDAIAVVLVSSLIANTILPFKKVSIDKRFFIEISFHDILAELEQEKIMNKTRREEQEEKHRLRSIESRATARPLREITGLKIVKKKDKNI